MADEEARTAKRMRFTGDFIKINVGAHMIKTFTVHEAFIKRSSDFFRKALDKKWEEGQSREIILPEDKEEIVEAYIGWLYHEDIDSSEYNLNISEMYTFLVDCYIFGDKVQDSEFCNHALDIFCKTMDVKHGLNKQRRFPGLVHANMVFERTPKGSPLRSLLTFVFARNGHENWDIVISETAVNPELAKELIRVLYLRQPRFEGRFYDLRKDWHKTA